MRSGTHVFQTQKFNFMATFQHTTASTPQKSAFLQNMEPNIQQMKAPYETLHLEAALHTAPKRLGNGCYTRLILTENTGAGIDWMMLKTTTKTNRISSTFFEDEKNHYILQHVIHTCSPLFHTPFHIQPNNRTHPHSHIHSDWSITSTRLWTTTTGQGGASRMATTT